MLDNMQGAGAAGFACSDNKKNICINIKANNASHLGVYIYIYMKKKSYFVAWAGLQLTIESRLALSSRQS